MRLIVTEHAAERYQQRVKPAMDHSHCVEELDRLCRGLEFTSTPPEGKPEDGYQLYAECAPGIWAAGVENRGRLFVRTVIVEGTLHPNVRRERNLRRKEARHARRAKRRDLFEERAA